MVKPPIGWAVSRLVVSIARNSNQSICNPSDICTRTLLGLAGGERQNYCRDAPTPGSGMAILSGAGDIISARSVGDDEAEQQASVKNEVAR